MGRQLLWSDAALRPLPSPLTVDQQARVRKRTRPVDKGIGRSCVLGVPAELALLHPIQNALGWHVLGFLCHGFRLQDARSGEA